MGIDMTEWMELLALSDDMDPISRMVLMQYSTLFDSQGRAPAKPKLIAKATGASEKAVRQILTKAKNESWLEAIEIDGRKGYRATIPDL
jgi:hypothetical protein